MDTLVTQNVTPIDTVEYVLKSELSSFYSDMISNQQGFYTSLITALAILFGLILIFTVWWHTRGVKLFIKEEVASNIKIIDENYANLINKQEQIIKQNLSSLEVRVEKINKELDDKLSHALSNVKDENKKYVDQILRQYEDSFEDFKINITKDLTSQEAELARAFAVICSNNDDYLIAANWWLHALEAYNDVGEQYMSGIAIDNLLIDLSRINYTKINQDSPIDIERTKQRIIDNIPDNRERDRAKVLKILDKIQNKIAEA